MSNKNSKTLKKVVWGIGLLLAGGAVGYGLGSLLTGSVDKEALGLDVSTTTLVISLVLSIFLVFLIHELGHILGGLAFGNRFALLIAGPLKVENENGKLRWTINRNLAAFGGLAMTIPMSTDNFKARRTTTVAAGPGASLLLALLALAPVFLLPLHALPSNFRFFLLCLGFLSFTIFVVTIIPMQSGGFMSDGAQLLNIYRDNPAANRYEALLQLVAELQQGKRPKDISEEQIEKITSLGYDDTFGLSGLNYQYYRAIDRREWEDAEKYMQLFQQKIEVFPKAFQNTLWAEVAIYYSLISPDIERARQLMDQLSKHLSREKNKMSTHLLHLAMARLKEEPEQEATALSKFQKTVQQDGISQMYKALLQEKMNIAS
ncbi:MAG: hypothetical protein KTR30_22855 [Saprospiraceae bacterium]|nr:hypothetical protein [Saprospiraceae bacterium]